MAKTKKSPIDINQVFRGVLYEYNGELIVLQRPEDKYSISVTYLAAHYGLVPAELDKALQLIADRLTPSTKVNKNDQKQSEDSN